MRVAHFVPVLDQAGTYGGPSGVCELLCDELAARGHRVDVVGVCPRDAQRWRPAAGRLWALHVTTGFRIARRRHPGAVFSFRLLWWFGRTHRRLDLVHLHGMREPMSVALMLLCVLTRTPFVAQAHGMLESPTVVPVWDPFCSAVLRRACVVLALTEDEVQVVAHQRRCTSVELLPNPAPASCTPATRGDYVLCCARLHPRKRVGLFVQMARLVIATRPHVQFVVVGPPEGDEGAVVEAVSAHPGNFRWVPGVPTQEARRWIAEAGILVVTAEREPFGMTIVEALSSGTPVLGTSDLALSAPLAEAGAMRVVPADAEALAGELELLLDDGVAVAAQVFRGSRWVADNASVGAVVDRLESVYDGGLVRS